MEDANVPMEPDKTEAPEVVPVDVPVDIVTIDDLNPEADREASPDGFKDDLTRDDAAMVRRALKLGWNIPQKYKEPLLNRLLFIALNDDPVKGKVSSHRERLSAIRTLLVAEGQAIDLMGVILNRKQEQTNIQVNVEQPKILQNATVEQLEGLQNLVKQIEQEKPKLKGQKQKSTPDKYSPPLKDHEV